MKINEFLCQRGSEKGRQWKKICVIGNTSNEGIREKSFDSEKKM